MLGNGRLTSVYQRLLGRRSPSNLSPVSEFNSSDEMANVNPPIPLSQLTDPLRLLLRKCEKPLTVIDVGARWGTHDRWDALGDLVNLIGFEPDEIECRRLNDTRAANARYLPVGLADAEGVRDLHVSIEPACSSLLSPVEALSENYAALSVMATTKTIQVACRLLDDVLEENKINCVSAIKLDTQGSELMILRGASNAIRSCALLDIEVQFNPLYTGAGLYCDVDRFLRDNGFSLWRFEQLVHYAPEIIAAAASDIALACDPAPQQHHKVANGQLFWGQAHFVRTEFLRTSSTEIAREDGIRAAVITGAYGHWDLAVEIIRKIADDHLLTDLLRALNPPQRS